MALFHALIRTHHITSRKKVAHLRKAADRYKCYALLRSGGCPGIMYCKGSEDGVREWVATVQVGGGACPCDLTISGLTAVQKLRYKDFQLASRPAVIESDVPQSEEQQGLVEVKAIQEFAAAMERRGVAAWWRQAMNFS
jgi:hypothetical protein